MFGLITRVEHERILADGQARAQEVIAKANADRRTVGRALAEKVGECHVLAKERDDAREENAVLNENLGRVSAALAETEARLAPFIAKRERGEKGRFVKGGGK